MWMRTPGSLSTKTSFRKIDAIAGNAHISNAQPAIFVRKQFKAISLVQVGHKN
jgi:hypothetical protein